MKDSSKYLIHEDPIFFLPTLAKTLGLHEAIILQKIHGWLNCKPHDAEGRGWIYNSYKSWQEQLPFISEREIRRSINELVEKGILLKDNFNKEKFDRTNWYSIDYEKLDSITTNENDQIDVANLAQWRGTSCPNGEGHLVPTNTNNNNNNNNNNIYLVQNDLHMGEIVAKEIEKPQKLYCGKTEEQLESNFNKIWNFYPRKKGKQEAFKHYKVWLKGKKILNSTLKLTNEQMLNAVCEYADEVEKNKMEERFIQMGSTFFNNTIVDYVELENDNN